MMGTIYLDTYKKDNYIKLKFINFYINPKIEHKGEISPLSSARNRLASETIDNEYAIFAGGLDATRLNTVDIYDKNLIRTSGNPLSAARNNISTTTVGEYALFAGGDISTGTPTNNVTCYNKTLVSINKTLSEAKVDMGSTTVGEYALFIGGQGKMFSDGGRPFLNSIDVFNTALVRSVGPNITGHRYSISATTLGDYGIMVGGYSSFGTWNDKVETVNSSLVKSSLTNLTVKGYNITSTTFSNYAIFAGGSGSGRGRIVDIFNIDLIRSDGEQLNASITRPTSTTLGKYALIVGNLNEARINIYDKNLIRTDGPPLNVSRGDLTSTTIGNFSIFAGGTSSSGNSSVVEVYELKSYDNVNICIPTKFKYKFAEDVYEHETSNIIILDSPVDGYVKIKTK